MSEWSLAGRSVAITGASGGIGRETAVALASHGAHMLLIGRNPARYQGLMNTVVEQGGQAELFEADLGDLASVADVARALAALSTPPTVLINNAGTTGTSKTSQGYDLAFGVNHLAHYLLTRILLKRMIASGPSRILNVASNAHYGLRRFRWSTAHQPRFSITGFNQYKRSKAANVAFTTELARRLAGTATVAVAIHPGVVATALWDRIPPPARGWFTSRMISSEEGARTTIECCTLPTLESGGYYTPVGVRNPAAYAVDEDTTAGLWAHSENLVAPWL